MQSISWMEATHVRPVSFDYPEKLTRVLFHGGAQAVIHEPRRLLGDADMLGQLDAGNALAGGGNQVNGDEPLAERHFAGPEYRTGLDGEVLFAFGATIPLAVGERVNFLVAAVWAVFAVAKANPREIISAGLLVVKVYHELRQRFKI
jgi:hypothetical protein